MKRIVYPSEITTLKKEYKAIFNNTVHATMQNSWVGLRDELRRLNGNPIEAIRLYPDLIEDVFVADYDLLVDIFIDYHRLRDRITDAMHQALKSLFHYSGSEEGNPIPVFQPAIAEFFMKHQKELKIETCYYCELSYINSYGFSNVYQDVALFLQNANRHQVEMYIRKTNGDKLDKKNYDKIMELRKQTSVSSDDIVGRFDAIFDRWMKGGKKSDEVKGKLRNHFDLDHFLPKSKCPIVGLSLMNFVPSCPVCNEKLKGDDVLGGENESDWPRVLRKVSPTSAQYNFGQYSQIRLNDNGKGWLRAQEHPEDYTLEFRSTDVDYQTEIIDKFHLEERYGYHKCEALRWHDLMNDYPPSRIKEMAKALKGYKTEEELRNDIFQNSYFENNGRCFDKLRRDILGIGVTR